MTTLKLLSWNINQKEEAWDIVFNSGVDAALLQEAKEPPQKIAQKINLDINGGWFQPGQTQKWRAAVVGLSERIIFKPIKIQVVGGKDPYALMVSRPGTMSAANIEVKATGEKFTIVSLYSYWENPAKNDEYASSGWIYADASAHRLISDLSALIRNQGEHQLILAGDLNILFGYGEYGNVYWEKRYNTVFERMAALNLRFVGPQAPHGGRQTPEWPSELPSDSLNVPTYHSVKQTSKTATRQLDFVFASKSIAERIKVKAFNKPDEWGPSDHCRVCIEMEPILTKSSMQ